MWGGDALTAVTQHLQRNRHNRLPWKYQLALHVCVTVGGKTRWLAAGAAPLAFLFRQPARGSLQSANCSLWAWPHTFPPVLPMLMTRSTISMLVHSLCCKALMYTDPYLSSFCFRHYWLASVVLLLQVLISCRAGKSVRVTHPPPLPLPSSGCSVLHQWRESRFCIDCHRILFSMANYLRRMDQFVMIQWEINICVSHPDKALKSHC